MSPLWHDEVGAYLSPYRLCLVRMQRGVLPQAIAEHEWRFDAAEDHSWSAPLARLEQLLSEEPWRAARTRVVLGDHWVRYVIVPWVATLGSTQERVAHGRELLAGAYGDDLASWEVQLSAAPPHAPRVACALPAELLSGVRAACAVHGGPLLAVQPQLIAAYSERRAELPASNSWFVTIEQGSLAAARVGRSGWDRVYTVRIGADWIRELKRLQTFGRLAHADAEEGQVYVDAPQSWRTLAESVAPGELGGLRWLTATDEPPVTTLASLDRVRRAA